MLSMQHCLTLGNTRLSIHPLSYPQGSEGREYSLDRSPVHHHSLSHSQPGAHLEPHSKHVLGVIGSNRSPTGNRTGDLPVVTKTKLFLVSFWPIFVTKIKNVGRSWTADVTSCPLRLETLRTDAFSLPYSGRSGGRL